MDAVEAAERVRRVDSELCAAVYPYDELRPRVGMGMEDVGAVTEIRRHLHRAEDMLDTGLGGGPPQVSEAVAELRDAYDGLERLSVSRLKRHHEVLVARAEGLRAIGNIVGIG